MIEINNLYLNKGILSLSYKLANKERYGILESENESGTELLSLLSGTTPALPGNIRINGFDLSNNMLLAKRLLTYLPQNYAPDLSMTVYEYLDWIAELYGNRSTRRASKIQAAMEFTGLEIYKDKLIRNLDAHELPFLGISQFLASGAEFLLVQSQSTLLSEEESDAFDELLSQLPEDKTVIFLSDSEEEIEKVCTVRLTLTGLGLEETEIFHPESPEEESEQDEPSANENAEEAEDAE